MRIYRLLKFISQNLKAVIKKNRFNFFNLYFNNNITTLQFSLTLIIKQKIKSDFKINIYITDIFNTYIIQLRLNLIFIIKYTFFI